MHQRWEACPPPLAGRGVSKDAECIQKSRKRQKGCVGVCTDKDNESGRGGERRETGLCSGRRGSYGQGARVPDGSDQRHNAGAVTHSGGPTHCTAVRDEGGKEERRSIFRSNFSIIKQHVGTLVHRLLVRITRR